MNNRAIQVTPVHPNGSGLLNASITYIYWLVSRSLVQPFKLKMNASKWLKLLHPVRAVQPFIYIYGGRLNASPIYDRVSTKLLIPAGKRKKPQITFTDSWNQYLKSANFSNDLQLIVTDIATMQEYKGNTKYDLRIKHPFTTENRY